jgi:ABC-type sugar transport system substrate-binding protein
MTQRVTRRLLACAFACAVLSLVAAPAVAAGDSWTFCVASARGDNVWITDVFAATRSRERLERDMKAYLAARGAARVDVQCPEPVTDKTAAVNAQFAAIEFNRKLGAKLHEAPARELGGER